MKFCKYCGARMEDAQGTCPACGGEVGVGAPPPPQVPPQAPRKPEAEGGKKLLAALAAHKGVLILLVAAVAAVWAVCTLAGGGQCKYAGCSNRAVEGTDWCYDHKCALSGCGNMRYSGSNYCFSHYVLYDDDYVDYSTYVSPSDLEISDVDLSSNSSYTVAQGTITNNGSSTVTFVKIKGAFEDRSGNVIDTDWTYAVGSEGLAPGESCRWRMSVSKDSSIRECTVTILDYDY